MTITQVRPGTLDAQIPPLIGESAVIALVPATDDRLWAAAVAWRVARALAAAGRRTALVDCFVNDPILHDIAGAPNDEGIVDAFEYGASLQRIAQQQPETRLYFIPAGTFAPDPHPLTAHPRWRRLSAGFRHEEARLLLFCADTALADLAAEPDGLIVLAPQGMDLALAEWPALAAAVGAGKPPLLAVIADEGPEARPSRPAPATPSGADQQPAPPEPAAAAASGVAAVAPGPPPTVRRPRDSAPMAMLIRPERSPATGIVVALVVVAALAALGYAYRAPVLRLAGLGPAAAAAPVAPARRDTAQAASLPAVDTLPYVVAVSEWSTPRDAFGVGDTLELHGWHAIITPVRLQGRIWYRVYAGPRATEAEADSLLADLRAHHLIAADGGEALALPLSLALPGRYTPGQAETERARLRAAGVPAFALGQADGGYRLYAGAFDAAPSAVLLQSLLTPAGGTGSLGPRVGFVP